jgi:tetraacyldisaccharide-1-P 4'-kinase
LADFDSIKTAAAGAEIIVTTEKDSVKLERFAEDKGRTPIYTLSIEVVLDAGDEAALEGHLERMLGGGG